MVTARILFDTEVLRTWHPRDGVPAPGRGIAHADAHADGEWAAGLRHRHWPAYAHDWADLVAQDEADCRTEAARPARGEPHPATAKGDEAGAKFGRPKMNALKLLLASAGRHYVRI